MKLPKACLILPPLVAKHVGGQHGHMTDLHQLRALAERYATSSAKELLPRFRIGGLAPSPTPVPMLYEPTICLVLSGWKHVKVGHESFNYGEGQYLITAVDMPVMATITVNQESGDYLAMGLDLDPYVMAELALEMGVEGDRADVGNFCVADADTSLLDTWRRLCELLERPQEIAFMAPLVERELLFRLLQGPQGRILAAMVSGDRYTQRIRTAAVWIRKNFALTFSINDLAQTASMSVTVFYRRFKQIMAMSPLQYQKKVRLYEARSRLMSAHGDIASVAYDVGYESPSQFSREYKRLFGHPPVRVLQRAGAARTKPLQVRGL